MSSGQVNGPGASSISQQLPDTKALDEAKDTEIIRLKNGKFKVGTSQGSVFNRTVRKVLMPKTYQREASKATHSQQSAAVDTISKATGKQFSNVSLEDRQITVAQFRSLLNPPQPQVPDSVANTLSQPGVKSTNVFEALQSASKGLHEGNQYKGKDLAGGARFANIHSPRNTVVHVQVANNDAVGESKSKPFHANFVGNDYIATQAPMGSKESPALMLQMLYNEDTSTVVNLTNPNDAAKGNMTYQYWPEKGTTEQHGNLLVQTTDIDKQDGFDVITLKIGQESNYGNELNPDTAKEVKIFHYHKWPDHGVPTGSNVEKFNHFMNAVKARGENAKTTVHCRAGVGRTGVFIAIDQLKQEARDGTLNRSNLLTKAAETVWSGRKDRGEQFVQRDVQFNFIISEMEKELSHMEKQGGTTTEVSDVAKLKGLDEQGPPPYKPTSQSFINDWFASRFKSETEMYDAIADMNNWKELELLKTEIEGYQNNPNTTSTQNELYTKLLNNIEKAQMYANE